MKIKDALSLSTRMFKTRPLRTLLTILGVGVGIGTVLFLVSLGYGLQEAILNKITTADSLLSLDVSAGSSELISLNDKSVEEISKIEEVEEVSPVITASAQVILGELIGDSTMYAVNSSYFRLGGISPQYGRVFDSNGDRQEGVISSAAARLFNIDPNDMVGRDIKITFFLPAINDEGVEEVRIVERDVPYRIVGIIMDDTESFLYIPMDSISDLGISDYIEVKVKVRDNINMNIVRDKITEMGFFVSALRDTIDQAKKIFKVVQIVLGLFGMIAIIVSAIGMFNTMTVMLLERTNEIGIMRSIGVTSRDIRKIFLFEAMLMGVLGGVGGVVIGYTAGEVANFFINILARNFGGQVLDLFVSPLWFVGVIIGLSAVIGLLTGIFPARRAAKLNPLDALRYK